MEIYLVGGAVRDTMLGITVKDRDWVVVGASAEQMIQKGYHQVGRDFPVFLKPGSGEEYALARTERKSGRGYTGFTVHASPEVSLEEDLGRRDLTINAMAEDASGNIIDPYHGRQDIQQRVLRHISPAFAEDPLRVLRVARFAARFAHLGFTVAEETLQLMSEIVASGELSHLVPERQWQEIQRALTEPTPERFFQTLRECGALAEILPELDRLFGVPQPAKYHPEIDTGIHTLMVLQQAVKLSTDPVTRFAALVHDVGKGVTPAERWPAHKQHETLGAELIRTMAERLRIPTEYRDLGQLVSLHHTACHRAATHDAAALLETLEHTDAFRRPERFRQFLQACEADARGRKGLETRPYPQSRILERALAIAGFIDPNAIVASGYRQQEIGEELRRQRIDAIDREVVSSNG